MLRRLPLWAMLVPLALALLVYWRFWSGERDAFRAAIERLAGPGGVPSIGGFPYRLQADLGRVAFDRSLPGSTASLAAERLLVDRAPFRRRVAVVTAAEPRLRLALRDVSAASLGLDADGGQASIRIGEDGRVHRLSARFREARLELAPLPGPPLAFETLELHLRETPSGAPQGATFPAQAQLIVRGENLRLGEAPLQLSGAAEITAESPLSSVAHWRQGGTVELSGFALSDETGPVASLAATVAVLPTGRLAVAGAVETVCPRTLVAAFSGSAPPEREFRRRFPARFALANQSGEWTLRPVSAEALRDARVRSLEPPCPALRR